MPARRLHRSPHEGLLYLAPPLGQVPERRTSGSPPARPPRPGPDAEQDPVGLDELLQRIDVVTGLGEVVAEATVIPLNLHDTVEAAPVPLSPAA